MFFFIALFSFFYFIFYCCFLLQIFHMTFFVFLFIFIIYYVIIYITIEIKCSRGTFRGMFFQFHLCRLEEEWCQLLFPWGTYNRKYAQTWLLSFKLISIETSTFLKDLFSTNNLINSIFMSSLTFLLFLIKFFDFFSE